MGPSAIPALTAQLDYYRRGVTMNIIEMLERIGPEGVEALDDWREDCDDAWMRVILARQLVQIKRDKEYIPYVAEGLLSERDSMARSMAKNYIEQFIEEAVLLRSPELTQERARKLKAEFDEWWRVHADELQWDDTTRSFVLVLTSNE